MSSELEAAVRQRIEASAAAIAAEVAAGGPARDGIGRLADRELQATAAIAARALELSTRVADRWEARREALVDGLAAVGREDDPERLEELLSVLDADRAGLREENAAVGQQVKALAIELDRLREYDYLAERLLAHIDDPELSEVVRSRRQDIAAQVAIAGQGLAGLRLIVAGNEAAIGQIGAAAAGAIERLRRRGRGS